MKSQKLIITGGDIITMSSPMIVEAVLIEGGRILCVGSLASCREAAGPGCREMDLAGKCLLPGFIDTHIHPMMHGMTSIWADLSWPKVQCIDDLVEVLNDYAASLPAQAPIRGFGFDWRRMKENRMPNSQDLDRVATTRPVQIMHASGHFNIINSYLLNEFAITANTPDPEGGVIGRYSDNTPNGQLQDSACDLLTGFRGVKIGNHGPNLHMPDPMENLLEYVLVGQQDILKGGITTAVDVQVTKREAGAYITAKNRGLLKIRVVMMYLSNLLEHMEELGFSSQMGDGQLSFGPLKLYADGSLTAGSAYFSEPYQGNPNYYGYLYHSPEELKKLIIKAHEAGIQTATHAQGAAAIQIVLDAVKDSQQRVNRKDMRHRIEHCGLPTEEQVVQMSDLGIWPSPQPQHVHYYGEGVVKAIGEKGVNYSPYGWFKKHGVPLVLSSDAPVAPPRPMKAIYAAVTRKTVNGDDFGNPEHKISVEDALKGYTITAAASIHREHDIGSIEVGKLADFAVLDRNPLTVEPDELSTVSVQETWIAGEKVLP